MAPVTLFEMVSLMLSIVGFGGVLVMGILAMRQVKRFGDFIMAERDATAHKIASTQHMPFDPDRDLKAMVEKKLIDDYGQIMADGVATDEDIARFGIEEDIIS